MSFYCSIIKRIISELNFNVQPWPGTSPSMHKDVIPLSKLCKCCPVF